jgi:uncharacterized protein YkwD
VQLLPPQTTVPNPTYGDPAKLAGFNRINELRALAGLGLLKQDALLDAAAQAHASWMVTNNVSSHFETAGTPGFTGVWPIDRFQAQGYAASWTGEDFDYNSRAGLNNDASAEGLATADGLIAVIYHRASLFQPAAVDMGAGNGDPAQATWVPLVFDLATKMSAPGGQALPASTGAAAVWPVPNATGVKVSMGTENPNPIPSINSALLGYPASVHCHMTQTLTVSSFTMTNTSTGAVVDAALIYQGNDPNNTIQPCAAGLVPKAFLAAGTTYQVSFSGTINGQPWSKTWSFTTGN